MTSSTSHQVLTGNESSTTLSISVVVCAYTEQRWDDLSAAIAELLTQISEPDRIVVVIDYNEQLLDRMRRTFDYPNVTVVPNSGPQGLSGARNSGVAAADSGLTLFLDDDALPDQGWIEAYRSRFAQSESIVGVGGAVV
ncbi:MAG: glycosyltransferase family A protein, partial [Actinomycetes bacterium]